MAVVLALVHTAPVRARVLSWLTGRLLDDYGIDARAERLDYNLATLSVRLENVSLAARGQADFPFFEARAIRASLPWSVLGGTLAIDSLELVEPRLLVLSGPDGLSNLPGLPQSQGAAASPPAPFKVGRLSVRDLDATFTDEQRHLSVEIRNLSFDLQPEDAGRIAGRAVAAGGGHLRIGGRETATTRLGGNLAYDGSTLFLSQFVVATPEGRVEMAGQFDLLKAAPGLDVNFQGSVDLKQLAPWLQISPVPEGTVNFSADVTGPLSGAAGTLTVSGERLAWSTLGGVSMQAAATVNATGAALDSLAIRLAGGEIRGSGRLALSGTDRAGALRLTWREIDAAAIAAAAGMHAPMRVAAALEGDLSATWSNPPLSTLRLSAENRTTGRTEAVPALQVNGQMSLEVDRSTWTLRQRHQAASGIETASEMGGRLEPNLLSTSSVGGRLTIRLSDVGRTLSQLRDAGLTLPPGLTASLRGQAQVDATLSGTLGSPEVRGTIRAGGVSIGAIGPTTVEGRLNANLRRVSLESLEARLGANAITGGASVDLGSGALKAAWKANLADLAAFVPDAPIGWRPSGALAIDGTIGGTTARPLVDLTISGGGLGLAGQQIRQLEASVRLVAGTAFLDKLEIMQDEGRLDANGTYVLASGRYSLIVSGRGLVLQPLPGADGAAPVPLTARLDLSFNGSGSIARPEGNGSLDLAELRYASYATGPGRVMVTLADGRATVDGQFPKLHASLRAWSELRALGRFSANAIFDDTPLAALLPDGTPTRAPVAGRFGLAVAASGEVRDPIGATVDIDARTIDLFVGAARIALAQPARLRYAGRSLSADDFAFRLGDTTLTATGRLSPRDDGNLRVVLAGHLADFVPLLRLIPGSPPLDLSGAVEVNLLVAGAWDRPNISATASVSQAAIAWPTLPLAHDLQARASYRDGLLRLDELQGQWQGATLRASGEAPARLLGAWLPAAYLVTLPPRVSPARLTARIEQLESSILEPFLPKGLLAGLEAHLSASLTAEADEPTLDAIHGELTFDRAELRLARVPFDQTRPTRLTIDHGRVQVADFVWGGAGSQLTLTGNVGLLDNPPRLDLNVKGGADLRMLRALLPEVATAGRADLNVRVGGTITEPELDGRMEIFDGEVRLQDPRIAATELAGTIVLSKDRLTIQDLEGNANGGTVALDGHVRHVNFQPVDGSISLTGRGIAIEFPKGLQSEADADLTLALTGTGPRLSGKVTVLRGSYRAPLSLTAEVLSAIRSLGSAPGTTGAPSLIDTTQLNVSLVTTEDLIIDTNYGRFDLGADLQLLGTVAVPGLTGRAVIREGGQVFLGGNTYSVDSGFVDFANPSRIEPDLDITARTRVTSYDITLSVSGTPDTIEAESDLVRPDARPERPRLAARHRAHGG